MLSLSRATDVVVVVDDDDDDDNQSPWKSTPLTFTSIFSLSLFPFEPP